MTTPSEKYRALLELIRAWRRPAVAYSGGVDSVFLLKAAADALGPERVLAVTLRADNFPEREYADARTHAERFGVEHLIVDCDVFALPGFVDNPPDRCYHCKRALFGRAREVAARRGCDAVLDGSNADDVHDYRPGAAAARELGVASPLRDVGLAKAEIRELLRGMGLAIADKPSFACLATRIPHGVPITPADIRRIGEAEEFFHSLGFAAVRVRQHGDLARIEVDAAERDRFARENLWEKAAAKLESLGYLHSALDLRGYRQGGMNAGPRRSQSSSILGLSGES